MSELIPDRLPSKATAGERRVFNLLQRLPDNCIAYYEPAIRNRHPDFVVMLPSLGVLLIEVKGWYAPQILRADTHDLVIQVRDRQEVHKHPIRQARDYMFRLMDEARNHPFTSTLLQRSGPRKGRFRFPFGHVVVLSNMRREQLSAIPQSVLPESKVITRDELDLLDDLSPDELLLALQRYFDPQWSFPSLGTGDMSMLRAVIHPEIKIEKPGHSGPALQVLDLRQERHARAIGDGHRIVYGVAGSGKTVLLIARAKLLAENQSKKILVLCFNRGLADHLKDAFARAPNVLARTFHSWGTRQGVAFRNGESEDDYGSRLFAHLQQLKGDAGRFDSVLIDEAQDFSKSWLQCAKLALKNPDEGDLLIVGDWGQLLYRRRPFSWVEAGIRARGRTVHTRFDLDRNYRNTHEILRIAAPFAASPDPAPPEDRVGQVSSVNADAAIRKGVAPELIAAADRSAECEAAFAKINEWLQMGLPTPASGRTTIDAADIAVLYPRLPRQLSATMGRFAADLEEITPINWPNDPRRIAIKQRAVSLRTVHSAKGLQWRAVILLWTDLLPMSREPQQIQSDRSLLYVGMTRAEDVLVSTCSAGSCFTVEIEKGLRTAQ